MEVSKEEILRIAKLADLKIRDDEIDSYTKNLEEILNFANIVNNVDLRDLDISVGATDRFNVFRKDEVKPFEDTKGLLENAPDLEDNMYKIPKVL